MKPNLLVVDDEPLVLELISGAFSPGSYTIFRAADGQAALDILDANAIDLVILDYSLPDLSGADLFQHIRAGNPGLPVIFLTGHASLETALTLMKNGARAYLVKPFMTAELRFHVARILQGTPVAPVPVFAGREISEPRPTQDYLFCCSEAMKIVEGHIHNLPRYADATVLITGPSGAGKSTMARRIHDLTWGNRAAFVEMDCSGGPRESFEREIFGGAGKPGLFETAGRGTVFLDKIGELEAILQARLFHVLNTREFSRVGSHAKVPLKARVIAANDRPLGDLVAVGRFRKDLYFRLNAFELRIPALNERGEDRMIFAHHFLKHLAQLHKKEVTGFTPEAVAFLRSRDFPGNVRELRNLLERAVITCDSHLVDVPQLYSSGRGAKPKPAPAMIQPAKTPRADSEMAPVITSLNLADLQRRKLQEALATAHGNKSKAAKLVGLSRTAFHRRLQKFHPVGGQE